ncbi:MAG: glycosyltransferase family 4 protein [Pseudomonadota bacterium]
MKILIAHNSYQHRGGEDVVAHAEANLLKHHGHQVTMYQRSNDELRDTSKVTAAANSIWSQQTVRDIVALCDSFQPDVIHCHNTFPLISPSLYWQASREKIPVIQTLHNFRLLCPQAMLLREQKTCEQCVGKIPWRAVAHKCYRDSALQSTVATAMLGVHRLIGSYRNKVSRYIVLSEFSREKFIAGGLPEDRIQIKPNFVLPNRIPKWIDRRGGVFIGRLSAEKGLDILIEAAKSLRAVHSLCSANPLIKIIGAGPLETPVKQVFEDAYLGFRPASEVTELLHSALFLIAPSTCYETFGLVAVEAFSCGVPVIASRHGGLGELINDGVTGLLFTPGDAVDLAKKISWAHTHPERMLEMGRAAYAEYLDKYTPEKNYRMLIDIYQQAMPTISGVGHAAQI